MTATGAGQEFEGSDDDELDVASDTWDDIASGVSAILSGTVYSVAISSLLLSLAYVGELTPVRLLTRFVGMQFSLVSVGNLLVRLPKKARKSEPLSDPDLSSVSRSLRIPEPRVVVDGPVDRVTVQVRGRTVLGEGRMTLLVSPRAMILWARDRETKIAHLAHELAHIKNEDSKTFARVGATLAVTSLYLSAAMWRAIAIRPLLSVFLVATIAMMFTSWLIYARFREHAADLVAATVSTHALRSALSRVQNPRRSLTHPSPQQRLKVIEDPTRLYLSVSAAFLLLGLASVYLSIAIGLCLVTFWGEKPFLPMIGSVIAGVVLMAMCWRLLRTWGMLGGRRGSPGVWLTNLLLGTVLAFFIIVSYWNPRLDVVPVAALWAVLIAWIILASVLRRMPMLRGPFGFALLWWTTTYLWSRGLYFRAGTALLRVLTDR